MGKEINKVESYWNERWKKVITKRPTNRVNYYISNYGRFKSIVKETSVERLLKPSKIKTGYVKISMKVENQKIEGYYMHRLVYNYFVENKEGEKYFVIHKDGNRENNHVRNLEVLNREQLSERWDKEGFYKDIKTSRKNVKLDETRVRLLKQRIKKGKTKKRILARQFNISLTQLKRIESGENWGHVSIEN